MFVVYKKNYFLEKKIKMTSKHKRMEMNGKRTEWTERDGMNGQRTEWTERENEMVGKQRNENYKFDKGPGLSG